MCTFWPPVTSYQKFLLGQKPASIVLKKSTIDSVLALGVIRFGTWVFVIELWGHVFSSLRLRIPVFAWESLNSSEPNKPKPPVVHPQVVTSYFQVKQATSGRFSREGNGKVRKRNGSSVGSNGSQWTPWQPWEVGFQGYVTLQGSRKHIPIQFKK